MNHVEWSPNRQPSPQRKSYHVYVVIIPRILLPSYRIWTTQYVGDRIVTKAEVGANRIAVVLTPVKTSFSRAGRGDFFTCVHWVVNVVSEVVPNLKPPGPIL